MPVDIIPFEALGRFENNWLDTRYHFSFADYHDPNRMGVGPLRVWNDDRIAPGMGFDPHPHRNMEIITYVRRGAITHRDNLGNEGRTEAGDVQVMSAGTGIVHAEYNLEREPTDLFQISIMPNERGHEPLWDTRLFPKMDRAGKPISSPRPAASRLRVRSSKPGPALRCGTYTRLPSRLWKTASCSSSICPTANSTARAVLSLPRLYLAKLFREPPRVPFDPRRWVPTAPRRRRRRRGPSARSSTIGSGRSTTPNATSPIRSTSKSVTANTGYSSARCGPPRSKRYRRPPPASNSSRGCSMLWARRRKRATRRSNRVSPSSAKNMPKTSHTTAHASRRRSSPPPGRWR